MLSFIFGLLRNKNVLIGAGVVLFITIIGGYVFHLRNKNDSLREANKSLNVELIVRDKIIEEVKENLEKQKTIKDEIVKKKVDNDKKVTAIKEEFDRTNLEDEAYNNPEQTEKRINDNIAKKIQCINKKGADWASRC